MATSPPPVSTGFLEALRTLAAGLVGGVAQRLELFAVELQEEKLRLIQTFFWIGAAVFTGLLALVFASLTLVCLYWETARLAVLGGLTAFYASALLAIILALRRHLARQPRPFAATLEELQKDRACIRPGN
jgi:uncharacterized membrane protein YqjE